ncbi:phage portal protein [Thauera sp.]|uniref:phage portal protein n=1 Tax=Thauera sp. TaxID=1905334 RepID=UPI0039E3202C
MSKRNKKARKAAKHAAHAAPAAAPVAVAAGPVLIARTQYDAAGHGRRTRGWRAPGTGPNRALAGLNTIRNRARDAARNTWSGAANARVWATNLIGVGIIARSESKSATRKQRFAEIWDAFVTSSDADGVLDFYGQQTLAVETLKSAGEVFVRFRPRRLDDGLMVPLQVQLLESDMVPTLDADTWPGMPIGHRIRQGIELDRIGRRAAYWCYREHPGDGPTIAVSHADLVRVPASEMRHIYKPARPGALRGVPNNVSVMTRQRSVDNLDDAVVFRQELSNLYAAFITREPAGSDPIIDPATGQPVESDHDGAPMIGLEPGLVQELAPGEDVKFSSPPDAGANYADFMRQQHLGIAAGGGTPYELLTGDIRDVSDRTLRIVINEFRRACEQEQWQLIIPQFCQPVRDTVGRAAVLAGLLKQTELAEFCRCTWSPHAWPYIHPTQDVQAKKMEVDAGFRSRTGVVAANGDDVEQIDAERAADAARERTLQIPTAQKGQANA